MRRFVYEDEEHDVKLTLDMSEEMFTLVKNSDKTKFDALRALIIYTFEKGYDHDRSWKYNQVDNRTGYDD